MNLLAIDTSTELATVALVIGNDIYSDEKGSLRQHAQSLLPMIEALLAKAAVSLRQLDGIVFGRGPGSFTGLRIACSVAKALAYAHDLPLFPVSSLLAIADEVYHTEINLPPDTTVLAMLDARMQEVYWANVSKKGLLSSEQVSSASEVILLSDNPLIIAGVGIDNYLTQFPPDVHLKLVKQRIVFPHARAMIRLVRSGLIAPVTAADALPVYVRELQLSKK